MRAIVALPAIEPTEHCQEQQPNDGRVDHERELISQTDETVRQITRPKLGHFYEAACQVTPLFVGDRSHFGHTSTERAQPLQPARECARERVRIRTRRQALFLAERDSEVTHPFIRALRGTPRCRRTIRSEGGVAQSTGRLSEAAKCPSAL